jgi:hypothetical protein
MRSKHFSVSDYYELLALHRALLEAQFCDEPNDLDVSASPIITKLHRNLLETLMNVEGSPQAEEWKDWLKIDPDRREWQVALKRAKNERQWQNWSYEKKKEYAFHLLSPFELDDTLLDDFIGSV